MEITNNLLVAMMFVMLLSIGIGNVLMILPAFVDGRLELRSNWIPASWFFLLLLQHFNMFWHTIAILDVEEYGFADFLYVVSGPVLLFLATSLMLPDLTATENRRDAFRVQYSRVSRQFFVLLSLLMAWMVGVDLVIGSGAGPETAWSLAGLVLFAVLAGSRGERLHAFGTVLAWLLLLTTLALRGLGSAA